MSGQTSNQANYWNLFYDLSVYFYYLEIYQSKDQTKLRYFSIFLAVTSSSSIAAWAIWQKVSWLWAGIIAASQVLNAIVAFLPHKRREKTVRTLLPQLHELLLDCEDKYDDVSKGRLTDQEIHQETMSLKREFSHIRGQIYGCGLPLRRRYVEMAETRAKHDLMQYTNE